MPNKRFLDVERLRDAIAEDSDHAAFGKAQVSSTGSLRYNEGKPEMSQLDPNFIMELADLLTVSAKKYGKYNWALGQKYSTVLDSLDRHIHKFKIGEDLDTESKRSHLIHAAANIMILWNSWKKESDELDDRYFKEGK